MLADWQMRLKGYRASEDWESAYSLLDQVMDNASGSVLGRAKYEHAYTRYSQDSANAPEALDSVRDALRLAGDDDELRVLCLSTAIGYCLHASETEAAREFVTEAGRIFASPPRNATRWIPHLHIWVAYYWQSRGNNRLAMAHLRDAIACCGESNICALYIARSAMGDALLWSGRREEAMRELRRALAIAPAGSESTAYLRGRIAHGEGKLEEAEQQLRRSLDMARPHDHLFRLKAVEALVQVLRDGGRLDEAKEILQPYKRSAMRGWMTRVLIRLQRLAAPVLEKGGERFVQKS